MVVSLVGSTGVASAHAFLVGSNPGQGARLSRPPSSITLVFSERVVTSATKVTVRLAASGRRIPARVVPGANAATVRVRLSSSPDGVYVVSWQDLSAEDGHPALGEFAFAAGVAGGTIPTAASQGAPVDPVRVAATVLFLAGLAVGLGGAVTGLAVDGSVTARSTALRAGLIAATFGAGIMLDDLAGQPAGLGHVVLLYGLAAVLAATAAIAAGATRRLPAVAALAVAAGVVWAADGHPALAGGLVGFAVNAVHLVVGAAWVGSLGWLLTAIFRYRRDHAELRAVAARYARLALPMVVVLGAAGGVSALEVLPSWRSVYASGYGRLLVVKTALFALALLLAATSRRWGIGRDRRRVLERAVPAEAAVVAAILVVTAVLANAGPPAKAVPLAAVLGPAPLEGPTVRAAGLAGELLVSAVASPGELRVQVADPDGDPVAAHLAIDAHPPGGGDVGVFPRSCGTGCYDQALRLGRGTTRLQVTARAARWVGGSTTLALDWPAPPDQPRLLGRLVSAMDDVAAVTVREAVTSNAAGPSYTSRLGPLSGRRLMALEPYSGDANDPTLVPDVQALTPSGSELAVYLPGIPAWITLRLDRQGRLAADRVVDDGHLVTDTFTYPTGLTPARGATP